MGSDRKASTSQSITPALEFIAAINKLIVDSKAYMPRDLPFFSDPYAGIRKEMQQLAAQLNSIRPLVQSYEQNRQQPKVTSHLYQQYLDAAGNVKNKQDSYKKMHANYSQKHSDMMLEEHRLNEQITKAQLNEVEKVAKEIAAHNALLEKLNTERRDIEKQHRELEVKVDSQCCTCLPGNRKVQKELYEVLARLKETKAQIHDVNNRLTQMTGNVKCEKLEIELKVLHEAIDKHIEEFPKKIASAESALVDAKKDLEKVNIQIDALYRRDGANIDEQVAFAFLAIYEKFIRVLNVIAKEYKDHPTNKMEGLYKLSIEVKKEIEKLFNSLWSSQLNDRNLRSLYQDRATDIKTRIELVRS